MKCKAALQPIVMIILMTFNLIMIVAGCTPSEVAIAEQVVHEAEVAEQAIEQDIIGPKPIQGATGPNANEINHM